MYRDSDGYILIDMGAADISKSTQSIVGFYDRIVESVNANKLVLVINFGTYSPMPAIAHKKLNYYEIVTNLYKITINSNDIVIIEETGESTVDVSIVPTLQEGVKIADFAIGEVEGSIYAPEQVDVINDNVTAENTTWSSDKIDTELDKKADSSSLATVATSGSYADLTNKPTLAAVATSGSYDDLTNKPTIPADLDDLSDVTLTSPADGQTLVYDSTSEQFVNATPPSGVTALSQLSDVSLTTPASGNSLVFDGTEWANDTLDAADIPYAQGVSVADKLDNVPTFDTLTSSDNNKLLGVSVVGSDISVGAVDRVTYTDISTVSDTVVNATNKDIYTTYLNKGVYILNASVLWKTSGTAQGLGIYIYSDNSMVAQDLEYTVGWCVQNLNVTVNIPTDNTELIVRLYQATGSNIAVDFNGNITKL